ncbi:hypothetical protein [Desulfonatronum parangueonense]
MMMLDHHRIQAGVVLGVPVNTMPVAIGYIHANAVMAGELVKVKTAQGWTIAEDVDFSSHVDFDYKLFLTVEVCVYGTCLGFLKINVAMLFQKIHNM